MILLKKYKKYLYICLLLLILLTNSYRKSSVKEGYSGGSKDINNKFNNIDNKFEGMQLVVAMLKTEIEMIKETINSNINI
jgi:hypothetical protein